MEKFICFERASVSTKKNEQFYKLIKFRNIENAIDVNFEYN